MALTVLAPSPALELAVQADLVSGQEAGEILGRTRAMVNLYAKRGDLPRIRVGGTHFYARRDVEELAERLGVGTSTSPGALTA
jgi:hypothetical protein